MSLDFYSLDIFPVLIGLHENADSAHNYKHLTNVAKDVMKASESSKYKFLTALEHDALVMAAYLHEVDDEKLNFELPGVEKTDNLPLAKALLEKYGKTQEFRDLTLEIISLVSTRTNHNTTLPDDEKWKLLVRDADRLQALGEVGIARCYTYTTSIKKPLFTAETLRCRTREELKKALNPERFANYHGVSDSMLDHFFDKLLHIGKVSSGDDYLSSLLEEKMQVMEDFVVEFGIRGCLDIEYLEKLQKKYC